MSDKSAPPRYPYYSPSYYDDTSVSRFSQSFTGGARREDENDDSKYFVVHTWFRMGLWEAYKFSQVTQPVLDLAMRSKGIYGVSSSVQPFTFRPIFETTTIWSDRESMSAFFQSPEHKKGVQDFGRDAVKTAEFGARRVFVDPSDIPDLGDVDAAKEFIRKIKNDVYYDVGR